jgi:hypothetical protein|nr:MAG TPA: hypothetical protein [Caudoviricetes sp.]
MEKTNQTVAQETKTEQVQDTKKQRIQKPTKAGVKNFICNRVLPFAAGVGAAVLGAALLGGKDHGDSNDDDYTVS